MSSERHRQHAPQPATLESTLGNHQKRASMAPALYAIWAPQFDLYPAEHVSVALHRHEVRSAPSDVLRGVND